MILKSNTEKTAVQKKKKTGIFCMQNSVFFFLHISNLRHLVLKIKWNNIRK